MTQLSALQIARKGTADPAEAANNLKNFLSKIAAPATIKNFKDAGVDYELRGMEKPSDHAPIWLELN